MTQRERADYPDDVEPESGFRLPLPARESLDESGQRSYDRLVDPMGGTIKGLRGPGGIQLYSPRVAELGHPLNQYLRFGSALGGRVRELAILTTARECDSQFEWAAHESEALREGVPQAIIEIVRHRGSTAGLDEADAIVIDLGRAALRDHKVDSATFARALKRFGAKGLVDLVALMGNYAATAALLTTFDMQLPPGQPPLLPID
ncbi:MAG: carboxymuconolactone decarboxylase [Rhodospirillales bacterium]|nr:carboxymuconolactone decarboxylase [Rhodospirillales bacterium]